MGAPTMNSVVVDRLYIEALLDLGQEKTAKDYVDIGSHEFRRYVATITEVKGKTPNGELVTRALHNIYTLAIQFGFTTLAEQTKLLQITCDDGMFPRPADLDDLSSIAASSFLLLRNYSVEYESRYKA